MTKYRFLETLQGQRTEDIFRSMECQRGKKIMDYKIENAMYVNGRHLTIPCSNSMHAGLWRDINDKINRTPTWWAHIEFTNQHSLKVSPAVVSQTAHIYILELGEENNKFFKRYYSSLLSRTNKAELHTNFFRTRGPDWFFWSSVLRSSLTKFRGPLLHLFLACLLFFDEKNYRWIKKPNTIFENA